MSRKQKYRRVTPKFDGVQPLFSSLWGTKQQYVCRKVIEGKFQCLDLAVSIEISKKTLIC